MKIADLTITITMSGFACAAPWAMQIYDEARSNGELMARAVLLTGKTETEIRSLAAESPLCFADFVAQQMTCPPTRPPAKRPATIVTRYGVTYCALCSLMIDYCRCGTTPAEDAAQDGDTSGLARRIRDAKQGR